MSPLDSRVTFRIVLSGLCILNEDFEAFKFEKKDFDGSRACLCVCPGEVGKGGNEVKVGEIGDDGETADAKRVSSSGDGFSTGNLGRVGTMPVEASSFTWALLSTTKSCFRLGIPGEPMLIFKLVVGDRA